MHAAAGHTNDPHKEHIDNSNEQTKCRTAGGSKRVLKGGRAGLYMLYGCPDSANQNS